jgi:hypothetical protein
MISFHIHASDAPTNAPSIVEFVQTGLSTGDAVAIPAAGSQVPEISFVGANGASWTAEIPIPWQPKQWDRQAAKRFKELAVVKALGSASEEQIKELDALSIRRRFSHVQTDPELILFEFRYQRAVDELRKFLEQNSAILKSISEVSSSAGGATERSKA